MPNPPMRRAGGRAGGTSRGGAGGAEPPGKTNDHHRYHYKFDHGAIARPSKVSRTTPVHVEAPAAPRSHFRSPCGALRSPPIGAP
eukprot:12171865-Alexandrium_andersonii.AAC.1